MFSHESFKLVSILICHFFGINLPTSRMYLFCNNGSPPPKTTPPPVDTKYISSIDKNSTNSLGLALTL